MSTPETEKYFDDQVFTDYASRNALRTLGQLPEKESTRSAARQVDQVTPVGGAVLDVGCSAGHLWRSLALRGRTDLSYVGIDIDRHGIDQAKESFAKIENSLLPKSFEFHTANVTNLPFGDRTFDAVVCMNVLEHLRHPGTALEELIRVARGRVVVRTLVFENTYVVMESRTIEKYQIAGSVRSNDVESLDPINEISESGVPPYLVYHNIWGIQFLRALCTSAAPGAQITIEPDTDFDSSRLEADASTSTLPNVTRVVNGMQVAGPILQPHHWLNIALPD